MSSLRVAIRGCFLQYKALFDWATPLGYVSSKLIFPVFQILFFVQLGVFATGQQRALYFAVGNAMQVTALNGIYGVAMTIANERAMGTLPMLLGSPASRVAIFFGRALMQIVDGVAAAIIGFAVAVALYGLDIRQTNVVLLLICVVVVSASTAGLGLTVGSIALINRDVLLIGNVVYFGLLLLAGVNFSIRLLPRGLQVLSNALPMTRGIAAGRQAVQGAPFREVAGALAGEAVVGCVFACSGYLLFRWLEIRSRRSGGLESF